MLTPLRELKVQAEILHKRIAAGEPESLERLRALPQLRRADAPALAAMTAAARRKHCLAVVAREHGFSSWEHAHRVLDGDRDERDFGTLLYASSSMLNHWFADYAEARAFLDDVPLDGPRRYLLVYKRHFFVADRHFVALLGMDPDDPDWEAIGWDWARPANPAARERLYMRRLRAFKSHDRGSASGHAP
ncbi:hypothetical protein [Haliangium sp.]|uniref:hypothetical protein n=1 Tax=Haliangium sp. TaxID=2663208 RepID=UPI003D0C1EE1